MAQLGYTTGQEGRLTGKPTLDAFVAAAKSGALPIDIVAYPDILAVRELVAAPLLAPGYTGHFRVGVRSPWHL